MDLLTLLEINAESRKVQAGGPGSGRHKGGFSSTQFDVRPHKTGGSAYAAGHAHVMDQLSRIKTLMENVHPSKVPGAGWGHAGTISDISKHLADIHNRLAGTGEYGE